MSSVVAVIGVGQLGSRYLQGLFGVEAPLTIYALDSSISSLKVASERLSELGENLRTRHSVIFLEDITELPKNLDLVIMACPADVRLDLAERVSQHSSVKYWILEKLLSNRSSQISVFSEITEEASETWVNLPYRAMDWHQKLRESLRGKGPFQVKAWGIEYGLLTNAIHYIDLLSYWSDSKVSSVICQFGFHDFYPSKRQGFVEAHGEIFTTFEDGSKLSLRCEKVNVNSTISQGLTLEIKSNVGDWKVDEENGIFIEPSGVITEGKIEFQSQMTGRIVTEILENGRSDLPTLNEVQTSHVLLLDAIQKIWAEKQSESTWAPVT